MNYYNPYKPPFFFVKVKKRFAICEQSLGRETRAIVTGQVVDLEIDEEESASFNPAELLNGIPKEGSDKITPILDYTLTPIRKPIISIEVFDSNQNIVYQSTNFRGNSDGFFKHEIKVKLQPENYVYQIIFKGSDSYRQNTSDMAYTNVSERMDILKVDIVGKGTLKIITDSYSNYLLTSDIDQTFLATDLFSTKGKLTALFEIPNEKMPIPGMITLYQKFRIENINSTLCFLSASPHFFRRSLLSMFAKNKIEVEAIYLKNIEGTVRTVLNKLIDSLVNLDSLLKDGLRSAFVRMKKFWNSTYQSVFFDQLSYKLITLLSNRLNHPTNAHEILLGDNTEADYFIYTLYQLIITGEISGKELEEYLYTLHFNGRDSITRDNAVRIAKLSSDCILEHGKVNPVKIVLVNQTKRGPDTELMETKIKNSLPPNIDIGKIQSIQPVCLTQGAMGFAVILHALNLLSFPSLIEVVQEMTGKWFEGKVIDEEYLLNLVHNLNVPDFALEKKQLLETILVRALS